jgi:hypothetical protein
LFVYNKSWNRLQPKMAEDLVYVYTNSRLMAKEKEKDKKKKNVDNVDLKTQILLLKKTSKFMVILIRGCNIWMAKQTVASLLQTKTVYGI